MREITAPRRWFTYLRERSPVALLVAVAVPQAVSSFFLIRTGAPGWATWASAAGLMGLLVLLRLMDEVKDEAKDRIAHPERPLPRGLLSAADVRGAVTILAALLLTYAAAVAAVFSLAMGVLLAACVVWAGLMYREFFASELLSRNPLVYALSHQLVVVLMYGFAVAAADPAAVLSARVLWWSFGGLGASFAVEVCRKLDPAAHPVLRTYLHHYGRGVVAMMIVAALILLATASWQLRLHAIVWPCVAIAALALPVMYVRPDRHAIVARAAGLAALAQMLSPTIAYVWNLR